MSRPADILRVDGDDRDEDRGTTKGPKLTVVAQAPLTKEQWELARSVFNLVEWEVNLFAPTATGAWREHLVERGRFAAMRAAQLYKSTRGTQYSTYATIWIRRALRKATKGKGEAWERAVVRAGRKAGQDFMAETPDTFEVVGYSETKSRKKLDKLAEHLAAEITLGEGCAPLDPEEAFGEHEERALKVELIQKALPTLPKGVQDVFVLRFVQKKSVEEIALELKIDATTVVRRRKKAFKRFREVLTAAGFK